MKKAFIKRPLSALLTVIMMLSALPLLATGSSAALPGGLDSYITVNSDKIAALSKKATTDGLIKKLTDYNWVMENPIYYHIKDGKMTIYSCYQDLYSERYSYKRGSNAEITFTTDYGYKYSIFDIGLDQALILKESREEYTYVSVLFKCDRKFHIEQNGSIKLNPGEENKYNDYEKYSFTSPFLSYYGIEEVKINGHNIDFYPKYPYGRFFISEYYDYAYDYIPEYYVNSTTKNCCRVWDWEYGAEGAVHINLVGQGNEYFAFMLNDYGHYILEEWTKWFRDVSKGAWYYNSVKYVYDKGFMSGYENGMFGVVDNIRRQDFVLILARIAGADLSKYNTASKFKDVPKGAYYAAAVNWAVQKGIVSGYQDGRFGVGDAITREQVATILYKYIGSPTVSNADKVLASYKDVSKISSYAKVPLAWAVNKGIISGMSDGRIAAKEGASRAQIASIIMRMDQKGFFKK